MEPNENQPLESNEEEFTLPEQVTVYTDPNSGICESCQ